MDYDISLLKGYESFKKIEKIDKGWSLDTKYYVLDQNDNEYVYRLSDISKIKEKQEEFHVVSEIYKTGIAMSIPIEFGIVEDQYCYSILSYIPGEQAEIILPKLSKKKQYKIGFQAGKILRKIHKIGLVEKDTTWSDNMRKKITRRIDQFEKCGISNSKVSTMISYVQKHEHLLTELSLCQNHGDFHSNNLILDSNLNLFVIDFNRQSVDHQYYEFNRISTSTLSSTEFAKGQIDGYFNNEVAKDFFEYLKFYSSANLIGTIAWCLEFSDGDISFAINSIDKMYESYDGLELDIPKWYF